MDVLDFHCTCGRVATYLETLPSDRVPFYCEECKPEAGETLLYNANGFAREIDRVYTYYYL